jgi:Alpha/beta hydrolase domain
MRNKKPAAILLVFSLLSLAPALGRAEVARVEITTRGDVANGTTFGTTGAYEQLVGKIYFAVDPANPRNRVIVDIDKAPKNAAGRVEMSADFAVLRPKDSSKGNGVALLDVVNRGNKTVVAGFNRASGNDMGDGLLMRMGYTVVWVGWEFDVPQRAGAIRIDVPSATGVTGMVHATVIPTARSITAQVGDLAAYAPSDAASPQNTLSVRDGAMGKPTTIPRSQWTLNGNTITLEAGFEPGRTYELSYVAANPPVAGLGFAAVRDTAAWIKNAPDALVSAKQVLAFGSSQSGRFLRNFLYLGFNADEKNHQVFDAVMAHIAGASRIDLNNRWATPTGLGQFNATSFPFADVSLRDPATGAQEGALDNFRARDFKPKIFYTNTGVEYWGGGRSAALIHTSPDGSKDLALPDNERVFFLTGSQHGPTRFPPAAARNGEQQENPNDYWYVMRALLVAMDKWMREGVAPPASQYPRLQDKTLVKASEVAFPNLPGVTSPRNLPAGLRASNGLIPEDGAPGTPLPFLVPQTDKDGIELAGVRLPEIALPLATYTGWNFRNKTLGGADQLYPLLGSYIPFPATAAQREQAKDPRASIAERYPSRDAYLEKVEKAGAKLVSERYLLADDLKILVNRAGSHWDLLMGSKK